MHHDFLIGEASYSDALKVKGRGNVLRERDIEGFKFE